MKWKTSTYIFIILFFFITGVILVYCHHATNQNSNLELSETVIQDLNRKQSKTSIPFTLDFPGNMGMPVIRMRIRKVDFYFVVDTGGGGNLLVNNGIEKYNQIRKRNIRNKLVKIGQNYFSLTDKNVYGNNIDGILGFSFISQYKTIIFDYKNKYILLNEKINNTYMQPMKIIGRHFYTNIYYDDKEYNALIDTGCNSFFINRKFIEDNIEQESSENFYYINLSIGNVYYENVKSFSFKYEKWLGEESVQEAMENNCFLGYSLFKNHIVYMDLDNLLFGIS